MLLCCIKLEHEETHNRQNGSIKDGFEMVTHPISHDYHQTKMLWGKIFDKAKKG